MIIYLFLEVDLLLIDNHHLMEIFGLQLLKKRLLRLMVTTKLLIGDGNLNHLEFLLEHLLNSFISLILVTMSTKFGTLLMMPLRRTIYSELTLETHILVFPEVTLTP